MPAGSGAQSGSMTPTHAGSGAPRSAGAGWAPRFTDELIRPFVLLGVSAAAIAQLITDPPATLRTTAWVLTVIVIGLGALSLLPWGRLQVSTGIGLAVAFAVAAGLLFPLPPAGASVVFAFIASTTAGEKLTSSNAALTVAAIGTATATAAAWLLSVTGTLPDQSPWWLSLAVGLPVYVGTARRERSNALRAAEYAAEQSERAAASEAREAALAERGRIAREIHDVLGHSLAGIAMQLDMADALHDSARDDEANEAVRRARGLAVSGIAETRRAVHALREDTLPLPQTLQRLADDVGAELTVTGQPRPVTVEIAQAVVRAAQESVTNAHKYAAGSAIALQLDYAEELIRLRVTDTGPTGPTGPTGATTTAPAPPDSTGGGMGLVGMRERAALLGGTLHAGTATPPATGWTVTLELPT